MKTLVLAFGILILTGDTVLGGTLDVTYGSIERIIVNRFLTEGGRRYLQGSPEETCAYAFVQEPRVSADSERLHLRFLFAGRAGTQVAGRCVGPGDNFDIIVSGVPSYESGELFLAEATFEAEHALFEVFAALIESQLAPLLRIPARSYVESYVSQLTARGAGTVSLESLDVHSIELGSSSAVIDADYSVTVKP